MTARLVASSAGTSTIVLPQPILAGDFVGLFFGNQTGGGYSTPPTGFTLYVADSLGSFNRMACYKTAVAADANATVTVASASVSACVVARYVDTSTSPASGGSTAPVATASVTSQQLDGAQPTGMGLFMVWTTTGSITATPSGPLAFPPQDPTGPQVGQGLAIDSFAEHFSSGSPASVTFNGGPSTRIWATTAWLLVDVASLLGGWSIGSESTNPGWSAGTI